MRIISVAAVMYCVLVQSGCMQTAPGPGDWTDARQQADETILDLVAREEFASVIQITDSIIAAGADDPRINGQRALALGMTGKTGEALAYFEQAILADYENCENHLNFAVLLMKTGKTGRALTEFNEAQRFCPDSQRGVIYRNLAVANLKMGREPTALQMVEEGLRFDKDDPYLMGLKGMLISGTNHVQAESLLVAAEREGELKEDFLYQFGLIMLRTDRPSRAIVPLGKVVALDPENIEYGLNYSEAMIRSGKWDEAEILLRDLVSRERSNISDDQARSEMAVTAASSERVSEMLARVLFKQNDFEEALGFYRLLPQTPETMDREAMCLHNLGRTREALEIQREVVAMKPDWTVGLINLSAMLGALGELGEAERTLVRVLQLDPENAVARVNLDIIRDALEGSGKQ